MKVLIIGLSILVIISIIAFLVHLLFKAFSNDQQNQDERILYLEKRINDLKKDLIWQIQWETKLRQDLEKSSNEEFTRIKKQLKKKSDNNV